MGNAERGKEMLKEIRDEEGLKRVWRRLKAVSDELFYMERMTEEEFVSLFLGGSRLYEGDGGVVFVFAENPHAVKIGAAAYAGRIGWGYFKRTFEMIRDELAERGVTCLVAEVPEHKRVRELLPSLGFRASGYIAGYFGERGLMIFSQRLHKKEVENG